MAESNGPDNVAVRDSLRRYWRSNLTIMLVLLAIWAVVGLGCGVLFADWLNQFHVMSIPLGFWFAQQGSIVVFVLLILVYAILLNRLDGRHRAELGRLGHNGAAPPEAAPAPAAAPEREAH